MQHFNQQLELYSFDVVPWFSGNSFLLKRFSCQCRLPVFVFGILNNLDLSYSYKLTNHHHVGKFLGNPFHICKIQHFSNLKQHIQWDFLTWLVDIPLFPKVRSKKFDLELSCLLLGKVQSQIYELFWNTCLDQSLLFHLVELSLWVCKDPKVTGPNWLSFLVKQLPAFLFAKVALIYSSYYSLKSGCYPSFSCYSML